MIAPTTPRLAATLIVVRDDPFEVLMVKRQLSGTFSSAWVFPGGAVEEGDSSDVWLDHLDDGIDVSIEQRALRVAAIRETYEESALIATASTLVSDSALETIAPKGIRDLRRTLARLGVRLSLNLVQPFAHWITPESTPRRFDTHLSSPKHPSISSPSKTVEKRWVWSGPFPR